MTKPEIEVGSLWRNKYRERSSLVRVMAYVEGYVFFQSGIFRLARYKGRVPFVEHWREWVKEYEIVESEVEV